MNQPTQINQDRISFAVLVLARAFHAYMQSDAFLSLSDADRLEHAWAISEVMNQIASPYKTNSQ